MSWGQDHKVSFQGAWYIPSWVAKVIIWVQTNSWGANVARGGQIHKRRKLHLRTIASIDHRPQRWEITCLVASVHLSVCLFKVSYQIVCSQPRASRLICPSIFPFVPQATLSIFYGWQIPGFFLLIRGRKKNEKIKSDAVFLSHRTYFRHFKQNLYRQVKNKILLNFWHVWFFFSCRASSECIGGLHNHILYWVSPQKWNTAQKLRFYIIKQLTFLVFYFKTPKFLNLISQ